MAVERDHSQTVWVARELYAWNITVRIYGDGHRSCYAILYIKGFDGNFRVFRTCNRIFVVVCTWVFVVLLESGVRTFEFLDGIDGHFAFIIANPRQHFAVGRESEAAICGELLFVDPIRDAVEYLVEFSVFRNLTLSVIEEELDEEKVVLARKGNHRSVGGENGHLLWAAFAQVGEAIVFNVEDIVFGCE